MSRLMASLLFSLGLMTLVALGDLRQSAASRSDKGTRLDAQGDQLPDGALARIGSVRLRHSGEIGLLSFAPDGKSLFSLSSDQTFRRWEVATGKELARFEKKGLMIYPSAQMISRMGGGRFAPGIIMLKGGAMIAGDNYYGEGTHSPASFSADGKLLATVDLRNTVLVLDILTGKTIRKIELKEMQGHSVALSPDGKFLAVTESNGEDNCVRVWDVASDKELPRLKLSRQRMATRLLFSNDGKWLAGITSGQIRLWDMTTGKRARLYEGHENIVTSIAFSDDGKYLASAAQDGSVRVWETASEEEVKKFAIMDQQFMVVAFSPDGKYVVAASADRGIHVWDLVTGQDKFLEGQAVPVAALAVSPDSKTLASADVGGSIRLWDLAAGKEKETVKQPDRLHGFGVYDGGRSLGAVDHQRQNPPC